MDSNSNFEEWVDDALGGETLAFFEWRTANGDISAFLRLTTRWSETAINQMWRKINEGPGTEDELDPADYLYQALGGVMPHDYDWMLQSAAVKDAVTAFEVYLESAAAEVLSHHRLRWKVASDQSVKWRSLVLFYSQEFGVDVETGPVKSIRNLRHLLTHRRGSLRTEQDRNEFGASSAGSFLADLDFDSVVRAMDELAGVCKLVEKTLAPHTFGSRRLPSLYARTDTVAL